MCVYVCIQTHICIHTCVCMYICMCQKTYPLLIEKNSSAILKFYKGIYIFQNSIPDNTILLQFI
jgi:hypothetical protein